MALTRQVADALMCVDLDQCDAGGGSYYHQLHHAHYDCNYGDAAGIPMDWLMGTFEDGSRWQKKKQVKDQ